MVEKIWRTKIRNKKNINYSNHQIQSMESGFNCTSKYSVKCSFDWNECFNVLLWISLAFTSIIHLYLIDDKPRERNQKRKNKKCLVRIECAYVCVLVCSLYIRLSLFAKKKKEEKWFMDYVFLFGLGFQLALSWIDNHWLFYHIISTSTNFKYKLNRNLFLLRSERENECSRAFILLLFLPRSLVAPEITSTLMSSICLSIKMLICFSHFRCSASFQLFFTFFHSLSFLLVCWCFSSLSLLLYT